MVHIWCTVHLKQYMPTSHCDPEHDKHLWKDIHWEEDICMWSLLNASFNPNDKTGSSTLKLQRCVCVCVCGFICTLPEKAVLVVAVEAVKKTENTKNEIDCCMTWQLTFPTAVVDWSQSIGGHDNIGSNVIHPSKPIYFPGLVWAGDSPKQNMR